MESEVRGVRWTNGVPRGGSDARSGRTSERKRLRVAGLFAGIGGFELGLSRAGHDTQLLCEIDPHARAVLERQFAHIPLLEHDIRKLDERLLDDMDLLVAGFPCQDLSQAGRLAGLNGKSSGLVGEVFRLLGRRPVPLVLLENVPFMLQLNRGKALEAITRKLEALGYRWAYRVIDSRSFGLPQRRRRVFLLASLHDDPRMVLFGDEAGKPEVDEDWTKVACGFYWTEGWRGLGWGVDCVPTLKGGSSFGIPSPPAIVRASREVQQPDIRDAERLQGFPAGWTRTAMEVPKARPGHRWRLVGNAVTVHVAEWLGRRLAEPAESSTWNERALEPGEAWPPAAWGGKAERFEALLSAWPVRRQRRPLEEFLRFEGSPLSARATAGFLSRVRSQKATIRCEPAFLEILDRHLARVSKTIDR